MSPASLAIVAAACLSAVLACSADDGGAPAPSSGGAAGAVDAGESGGVSGTSAGSWPGGASGSGGAAGAAGASGAGAAAATGGAAGGECKTSCLGNECGFDMPNGCGSSLDCGDCGPGTDYCVVGVSEHAAAVHNAHLAIQSDHPAWFDPNDTWGSGAKLLDLDAFRNEVVSRMTALGKVAISDPNDNAEIRVRGAASNSADNFRLVTSSGYSWDKYTSTCSPAGF